MLPDGNAFVSGMWSKSVTVIASRSLPNAVSGCLARRRAVPVGMAAGGTRLALPFGTRAATPARAFVPSGFARPAAHKPLEL